MTFIQDDIRLTKKPLNYDLAHAPYFEPHYKNLLTQPNLLEINNVIYSKSGVLLDLLGNKIVEHLPYFSWGTALNNIYWLKGIIKSLFKFNISFYFNSKHPLYLVVNPMSDNFFHWITEVVPKLQILKSKNCDNILLPSNIRHHYQLEILKKYDFNIIYFNSEFIFIKKLKYVTNFSQYPGYYAVETINIIRNALNLDILHNISAKFNPIYISRRLASRRKISNELDILEFIQSINIKIIDIENFTFSEITSIFTNASHIISIHGAGLTNMIFMQKGNSVFELLLENTLTDKCYYFLANACELNYSYQFCSSLDTNGNHVFSDFHVDVNLFKNNIFNFLSQRHLE
jgi:capsular polysaccharide biosynthesis protein